MTLPFLIGSPSLSVAVVFVDTTTEVYDTDILSQTTLPMPYNVLSKAVQPSMQSRQVASKLPVYHGSATSPGREV